MAKVITVNSSAGLGTVSQILKSAGVSNYNSPDAWNAVAQASGLADYNKVYNGQKITIPDSLFGGSTASAGTSAPQTTSAGATAEPQNQAELTQYLNDQQQKLNDLGNYDAFNVSKEDIQATADSLGVNATKPEAPNYEQTFNTLKSSLGLDQIENTLAGVNKQIMDQQAVLQQQKSYEKNRAVPMGVIEGRVDKATADKQDQITFLQNTATYLTNIATNGYNYINMTMQYKNMDYTTAKDAYDKEFEQKLSIRNSLVSENQAEKSYQLDYVKWQQSVASAQVSMYADQIQSGQIVWGNLSSDQKLAINKVEVQAGLPIGFLSQMQIPATSKIQNVSTRVDPNGNTYADILYVDPATGATEVKHQLLGKTKSTSSSSKSTAETTEAAFRKSLANPGYAISATLEQGNNYNDSGLVQGKDWIDREQLASKLAAQYGMPIEVVKPYVYSAYPDR